MAGKITIYTINDCPFCKAEKEYLATNNLSYEEKNLETNREFLTEMLAVSNNFAGTPVSKIEKEDGTIAVLKGFTKEEFDKTLGLVVEPKVAVAESSVAPMPPAPTAPSQPVTEIPPLEVPQAAPIPTVAAPTETSPPPRTNDQLDSILNDLQKKADTPTT